jgi:UDP-N-acetylmuramate: L-alanyl-gamma-D-glutamyl-meso-diaminopimelate ligase
MGWFPERINSDLDAVVLGMHAKQGNPEMDRAQELNIPIYSYPEFLYEQSKEKTRVVIAGSHGKTTITSMILHVLQFHGIDADYMVGAQLKGFDRMVRITEEAEFMVLEGDEYLSSAIDLRSKFLLYKPQIALISGIAWDHMNVFPTYESYLDTFKTFIKSIRPGGALVYFEGDEEMVSLLEEVEPGVKLFPYHTPSYRMEGDQALLQTSWGDVPLSIYGTHNLQNMEGARWICQHMGVQEEEFYEAIASFEGANKRLESFHSGDGWEVIRDFAHAPSKVKASVKAVRERFPSDRVSAFLELHTYSSLNKEFIPQYEGSLRVADRKIVYYDPEAMRIKGMPDLSPDEVAAAFDDQEVIVLSEPESLKAELNSWQAEGVWLIMSSGNLGGIDLNELIEKH